MFLSTSLHFSPAIIDEVGNFLNNKINYLDCAEELAALVVVQKPLDRHYETLKHLRVKEEVRPNNPVELIPELEQLGGDQPPRQGYHLHPVLQAVKPNGLFAVLDTMWKSDTIR